MNSSDDHSKNDISPLLAGEGLPNYSQIDSNHINRDIPILIDKLNSQLNKLEVRLESKLSNKSVLDWEDIMTPIHQITESLRWSWSVVCHLNSVKNSTEIREAHNQQQPEVVRFSNRLSQSKVIYLALSELIKSCSNNLNKTQHRIIQRELLSMKLRGVGLKGEEKILFNKKCEQLAELSTKFSNNVLDATKDWSILLTKDSEVDGLPIRALEILATAAIETGDKSIGSDQQDKSEALTGPWRLGLDLPRYIPFITHAKNRALREKIYKAHVSRASEGKFNNKQLIEEILSIRTDQAKCLGYDSWADLSLANKMANNVNEVELLLEELRTAAFPVAQEELKELKKCAKRNGAIEANDLAPWDISFWSERLRQERFKLNQEELRPWFPLPQVLDGLFNLCTKLFDISIENADGEAPIWNEDVRFFKVWDNESKSHIASFYLDPFSRPENKRGGAWMDECLIRKNKKNGRKVLPVAYLVCNQTPPVGDTPSLMSFEEVETLFHEFGHGLQHMLTKVNYPEAAGINNVDWDAVELPSQFMENWCLDYSTIMSIAKHWETGEPLPEKEFKKLRLSRTFNSGLATLRQIHFAVTDLKLHSNWHKESKLTPDEIRRQVAVSTTLIPPIPEDQFLCSFNHIFSGGYSAGYYSYKWAEVLSADAFEAFEEIGLQNESEIKLKGKLFRDTILSLGGSRSPNEIFESFRGRSANTKALIRHSGLAVIEKESP